MYGEIKISICDKKITANDSNLNSPELSITPSQITVLIFLLYVLTLSHIMYLFKIQWSSVTCIWSSSLFIVWLFYCYLYYSQPIRNHSATTFAFTNIASKMRSNVQTFIEFRCKMWTVCPVNALMRTVNALFVLHIYHFAYMLNKNDKLCEKRM